VELCGKVEKLNVENSVETVECLKIKTAQFILILSGIFISLHDKLSEKFCNLIADYVISF
jgi:hypothetical protein